MNEVTTTDGRPWGMCYVYGCPLLGSIGHQAGDGKWFCFCHINMPSNKNDEITMALNSERLDFIVKTTLDIRACGGSFFLHPGVYRRIQERLRAAGRPDLLLSSEIDASPHRPGKPIVNMWLMRLERELIDGSTGENRGSAPATVPTAPVLGPTHASTYHPYAQGE
jgi:hypothetical protein